MVIINNFSEKGYLQMAWYYSQSTGELTHNGAKFAKGYSGKGMHKNKPGDQNIGSQGPIPRGYYVISGFNDHKSPMTIVLEPIAGTNTFGRSAFRIHGDNPRTMGASSEGCIIINGLDLRTQIFNSDDNILVVIS